MRRLPVYLLVDCSESMAGDPFNSVCSGIDDLIRFMRNDPQCLETVFISVITFSNTAKKLLPLTEVAQIRLPQMALGSGTALGEALEIFEKSISEDVVKSSPERKGDYKPLCFILSDGEPTGKWEEAAERVKNRINGKKAFIMAIACGPDVSVSKFKRITDDVIHAKELSSSSFKEIFKWVSTSVSTASQAVTSSETSKINLEKLPKGFMEKVDWSEVLSEPLPDRQLFLHARCMKSGKLYIMKFLKDENRIYNIVSANKVDLFDLSSVGDSENSKIDINSVRGNLPCPYCENEVWAFCGCGKIHCCPNVSQGGSITLTCPWCENTGTYSFSSQSFEIGKGLG